MSISIGLPLSSSNRMSLYHSDVLLPNLGGSPGTIAGLERSVSQESRSQAVHQPTTIKHESNRSLQIATVSTLPDRFAQNTLGYITLHDRSTTCNPIQGRVAQRVPSTPFHGDSFRMFDRETSQSLSPTSSSKDTSPPPKLQLGFTQTSSGSPVAVPDIHIVTSTIPHTFTVKPMFRVLQSHPALTLPPGTHIVFNSRLYFS